MRKLLIGFGIGLIVAWIIETRRKQEEQLIYKQASEWYQGLREERDKVSDWLDQNIGADIYEQN